MIKKKAILFPYTINNCDIVKHRKLLEKYEIIGVDTLMLELKGKDVSCIYNGQPEGIKIGYESLDYEVLILGDGSNIGRDFDKIYEYVKEVVHHGKDILILYFLTEKQKNAFEMLCNENNVKCIIYSGLNIPDKLFNYENEILSDISVPVVFVGGVAERSGKFEIQLILNDYFKRAGYNVAQIGTKNFSELFGLYSFPQFMYSEMSESQKIVCFNELCKGLEIQDKPDILIIGLPGSLIPYNNYFTNKFGVFAFEIGKAIKADAVVISLDNAPYENQGINKINQVCKVYFGNEVTAFSMSNCRIDVERSIQEKALGYVISDKESVCENINRIKDGSKIQIYNSLDSGQLIQLAKFIENDLSDMDIKLL